MTAKQITDKIALLKQAMKDAKVTGVKEKIKSKIEDLRQQAKTSNISTTQLAKSLLGSQRKVSNMTDAELRSAIKQLKPRSEYTFLKTAYYKPLGVVKDDLKRFAKPVGWRIKGKNNVHKPSPKELAIAKRKGTAYYEDRPNRADVVRPVKLEDGGMMAKGGKVDARTYLHINKKNDSDVFPLIDDGYYVKLSKHKQVFLGGQIIEEGMTKTEAINFAKDLMSRWNIPNENLIIDEKYRVNQFADGGMMAKGGNTEQGSAHIYITMSGGHYKVYHGSGVTLKNNAPLLMEAKDVKDGTWQKMWDVLNNA